MHWQLCTRVTGYSGFKGPGPVPGYCLVVDGGGDWVLLAGSPTPLANGTLPAPFSPAQPHALALSTNGTAVTATVNGTTLASVSSTAFAAGMVALGSGYHPAAFDDFLVAPVA